MKQIGYKCVNNFTREQKEFYFVDHTAIAYCYNAAKKYANKINGVILILKKNK